MAGAAYSPVANFIFEPQLCQEYATAKFVEQILLITRALGVVRTIGLGALNSSLIAGGELIDLPYFKTIASLISLRDLTATSAPSDLAIDGLDAKAVILRRKAGPVKFTEDVFIRGLSKESVGKQIGDQIGNYAAKEIQDRLIDAAIGGLAGSGSTLHTLNDYVTSGTKAKLTFEKINQVRLLLGDAYNQINTIVMHSDVFYDLFLENISQYKIENVAGMAIVTGIPQALGLRVVVIDNASLKVTNGGSFKIYKTLFFGTDAMTLIFQQNLRIESERRLDYEAPYWRVLGNFDFAPILNGVKWTGTGNPTNANVLASTYWDEAYNDHREQLAAIYVHNATAA